MISAKRERGPASGLFDSGSRIGSALSIPLISWLISSFGWRESFFATGVLGFIRPIFWIWLYRDPEKYSSVIPERLAKLQADRNPSKSAETAKISWSSLFRCKTLWGMMTDRSCLNFVIYFFITGSPPIWLRHKVFRSKSLARLVSCRLSSQFLQTGLVVMSRLALSKRLDPHLGSQNMPCRRTADVVGCHSLRVRCEYLCRARALCDRLWRSRIHGRRHLAAPR